MQVEKSSISPMVLRARYSARKPFPPSTIRVDRCPICLSDDRVEDVLGGNTNWAQCNRCNSGYKMTFPSEEVIREFYETEYREASNPLEEYPALSNKMTDVVRWARQMELYYNVLKAVIYRKENFLDIGTSSGWVIHCVEYMGGNAYGVELNEVDRKLAKEMWDITLYPTLEDLPVKQFGMINMSHVLEHFLDPISVLKDLRENYMIPGAHIMLEVPTVISVSGWSSFHAIQFSTPGLIYTMEQAGFEVKFAMAGREEDPNILNRYPPTLQWALGYNPK